MAAAEVYKHMSVKNISMTELALQVFWTSNQQTVLNNNMKVVEIHITLTLSKDTVSLCEDFYRVNVV
jgi:hypothetical protein